MRLWLSPHCALRMLETPSVYHIPSDELYELDHEAMSFLTACAAPGGAEAGTSQFITYCLDEGILSETPVTAARPPVEQSPEPSLRYLELQITRRCNLRCGHCYIGPAADEELRPEAVRVMLDEFQRMQGLRVLITGGEPLLHRDFHAINSMLADFSLRYVLFTNGLMLTDSVLGSLAVHEIQISIDGIEEAHDALRGRGSYLAAMGAIRRAMEAGFQVSVSTMVHPGNLGDFPVMDHMFRSMGVRDWTVDVPCREGRLKDNPGHVLAPTEAGKYLAFGYGGGMHGGGPGHACGRHLMSVMADGSCAKCAFYSDKPSGSADQGLRACWDKVRHFRLDELDCDCDVIDECRGGCRYRALTLGSEKGRDLYKCALYGKIAS